jgi:thiosulfate dehydrogenase
MVRAFIAGLLVGMFALLAGIFLYFRLGIAPVGTAAAPMLFEKTLAKAALHARLGREKPGSAPIASDQANLTAGAQLYVQNCSVCHGLPKQPASAIAHGMFPRPPQLFVDMVTEDPEGEIYWKTKGGIRLTGMPAFGISLSETQLWQVSLLLKHADSIPPESQKVLLR